MCVSGVVLFEDSMWREALLSSEDDVVFVSFCVAACKLNDEFCVSTIGLRGGRRSVIRCSGLNGEDCVSVYVGVVVFVCWSVRVCLYLLGIGRSGMLFSSK